MSASLENVKLGSLGQAARGNQLSSARGILMIVGLLTLAINGFIFVNVRKGVDDEINKLLQQGLLVDQATVAGVVLENQIIYGVGVVLGIVFITLGGVVYKSPVLCVVSGLVLYVAANIGFGLLDPASIASGIIVKVLIVMGLVKSLQSALAYNSEKLGTLNSLSLGDQALS